MAYGEKLKELAAGLHRLAVFRPVLEDAVVKRLAALLDAEAEGAATADGYCAFVAALYEAGGNLGDHLLRRVLESDNAVVRLAAQGAQVPKAMQESLWRELALFEALAALDGRQLAAAMEGAESLPAFESTPHPFARLYKERLEKAPATGYGMFALYHMFTLAKGGRLCGVKNPDPQRLDQLTGYETEREQVLQNTKALIKGLPAANVLLYGDAGTGKSSTVKALANEYRQAGLRLVEVRRDQLYEIPRLMDALAGNPLKFILFIDDLSFGAEEGGFTALKAILEGNVGARPKNLVVYATSNRRHMVRERFSDRTGDEVHAGDALEEQASLAARFGLVVTFLRPDRQLYARIVKQLAQEQGIKMEEKVLLAAAEAHALRCGGRTPRAARQFAEGLKAQQAMEQEQHVCCGEEE